jgi:hypothetical protein
MAAIYIHKSTRRLKIFSLRVIGLKTGFRAKSFQSGYHKMVLSAYQIENYSYCNVHLVIFLDKGQSIHTWDKIESEFFFILMYNYILPNYRDNYNKQRKTTAIIRSPCCVQQFVNLKIRLHISTINLTYYPR